MTIKHGPWAPYEPTRDDPWDLGKAAHLHRRAGFGAAWAELQRDLKDGPGPSVERLLRPRTPSADEKQIHDGLRQAVLASGDDERLKAWWLYRILYDADPLREKLTLFWHGHFATSNRKVQSIRMMLDQNELFRRHALERFGEMLSSVVGDGAMLVWLDGINSPKAKPNENFAREFLELFTVGIGHYTEQDIREAARAFTGWTWHKQTGRPLHDPARSDPGEKTFLKQTGSWGWPDIVRITLEQPAAATFLCRKLYRFLVSEAEEPDSTLVEPLADELRRHEYSIGRVVGIILRSRHFYAKAARRQRVKGPVEFAAGLARSLELPRSGMNLLALAAACERQGQNLFYPPNVKGWDGGKTWINSTSLLERGNWISDLVWGNADLGLKPFDALAWARDNGVAPERTVEALAGLLLQGDLSPKARELATRAGRDGTPAGLRKALQLLLHCPEYQLA